MGGETSQLLLAIPEQWGQPAPQFLSHLDRQTKQGTIRLDYLDHAQTTAALIAIDPLWTWEPFALDEKGLPLIFVAAGEANFWIRLTVLGKTLPAIGTAAASKNDVRKELIGDAIRNGAMRFGIALGLWSKAESLAMAEGQNPETLLTEGSQSDETEPQGPPIAEEERRATEGLRESLRERIHSMPPEARDSLRTVMQSEEISLHKDQDLARVMLLVQQTEAAYEAELEEAT